MGSRATSARRILWSRAATCAPRAPSSIPAAYMRSPRSISVASKARRKRFMSGEGAPPVAGRAEGVRIVMEFSECLLSPVRRGCRSCCSQTPGERGARPVPWGHVENSVAQAHQKARLFCGRGVFCPTDEAFRRTTRGAAVYKQLILVVALLPLLTGCGETYASTRHERRAEAAPTGRVPRRRRPGRATTPDVRDHGRHRRSHWQPVGPISSGPRTSGLVPLPHGSSTPSACSFCRRPSHRTTGCGGYFG